MAPPPSFRKRPGTRTFVRVMHPIIAEAAAGRLPDWAQASPGRRDHMARVAEVMVGWGRRWGIEDDELRRWRAAAMLHDALRDADPETLRPRVPPALRALPAGMLHGPATAARLAEEDVHDASLLMAVGWHTTGHPALDRLGRVLYLADYTEPGRSGGEDRLADLRARVPGEMEAVLLEVAAERIGRSLSGRHPLRESTVAFWNVLVGEGAADG